MAEFCAHGNEPLDFLQSGPRSVRTLPITTLNQRFHPASLDSLVGSRIYYVGRKIKINTLCCIL
jgi:hypothetical protein